MTVYKRPLTEQGKRIRGMEVKTKIAAAVFIAGMVVSSHAMADSCCPSGGNGGPAADGQGESMPKAVNPTTDPVWQI